MLAGGHCTLGMMSVGLDSDFLVLGMRQCRAITKQFSLLLQASRRVDWVREHVVDVLGTNQSWWQASCGRKEYNLHSHSAA